MIFDVNCINIFMGAMQIPIPKDQIPALNKILGVLAKGKHVSIEIKPKRIKRSLDANSCLWAMLRDMAKALHTTDKELYLLMLQKYGVCDWIACVPEAVQSIKQVYRVAIDRGDFYHNGTLMTRLQVFRGSSTYNTEEFSALLDGVIADAKEIGVDYVSEADKALLLEEWGTK